MKIIQNIKKPSLNENTRIQGIALLVNGKIDTFSPHIKGDIVAITDNSDFTKIYAICSVDFYNGINNFEKERENEQY